MKKKKLYYLSGYALDVIDKVESMLEEGTLAEYLLQKYPRAHEIANAKALYHYTQTIKNHYLRQSPPLSKVIYDDKLDVLHNALGLHSYVSRVPGNKLKAKKEIRIGSVFKKPPEPFLRMLVVHELAHIRQIEHNKAFDKLCHNTEPA